MLSYVCLDGTEDDVEREVLHGVCSVQMLGLTRETSRDEFPRDVLAAADVVAVWHTIAVDAALLGLLERCRVIVRMGVGYNNVDIAAAGALGIPVVNIPDYGTEEVADSALSLILGLYRGTLSAAERLSRGESMRGADAIAAAVPYIRRVRGSTLGLVGLGRIGTAVALRAKACGFDVSFHDPYREDGADKALGIRRERSLAALLRSSACVSLHCNCAAAGSDASASRAAPERLIDADALALMPRGALLVNTARGELVDEEALADALCSGHVAAAALDVHAIEPYARGRGPLGAAPNLFCTPHLAWYSPEAREEMRRKGAEAARRACEGAGAGRLLENVVNASHLDRELERARAAPR